MKPGLLAFLLAAFLPGCLAQALYSQGFFSVAVA